MSIVIGKGERDVYTSTSAEAEAGSRIITALEHAWAQIRHRHPDVPPVVVITGTGRQRRGYATLGHFDPARWRTGPDGRLPELFVAGELLAGYHGHSGGHAVLETLLHEAAHGIAHTRGIKDCSRQNRYHNRHFATIAGELGLTAPDQPHSTLGWSQATLHPDKAAAWSHIIDQINHAGLPHLGAAQAVPTSPAGRSGTRIPVACRCLPPRRLSVTARQFDTAPLLCGACGAPFDLNP
jgi:hypothetical protein